jgi:signal transduction histidine kinase
VESTPRSRLDHVADRVVDAGIVLATLLVTLAVVVADRSPDGDEVLAAGLPALASVLPLFARRRWPVAVLLAILAIGLAVPGATLFSPPALVALYTVAALRERRLALAAAALTALVFLAHRLLWGFGAEPLALLTIAALVASALAAGLYRRARLDYLEQLRERTGRLERERTLLAEQAVSDERLRIARELHDVVGHNVSLMVIGAQALGAESDDGTREATDGIARLGRETMAEMHAMLGLLRPGDVAAERAPQPRLDDLRALVEQTREAGLEVELLVEGEPRPLPVALDLSAYRIVQEALTNVVRHAGASHASVRLLYHPEALALEVIDDGCGQNGGAVPGHGIVGMRERVALFGGELELGQSDGRGFRVAARLPCEAGER